ncbi:MAG: MBL fold metallo-hydrolase [Rhodocyclaceae bacterium]|nr:MBL fold metallo-hydrolase [Rhodocyclaceae bacterium]
MRYLTIPVTAFAQNATLLWDETLRAAIVDPGGDLEEILAAAREEGVTIEKILLTHGHVDHAGAAAELRQITGAPIEGPHCEDAFWLAMLPEQARMFGFAGKVQSVTPDRWLADGDLVTVGTTTLEVIHTPGHTPGHVCFFHRPSRLALVGDVLFAGSIGRTDFPRGDHAELIRSIRAKLFPLGDEVRFIPGHGPESTFGDERENNPFVADWA